MDKYTILRIILVGFEILAAATGLICFRRNWTLNKKLFVVYLIAIAILEIIGNSMFIIYKQDNRWLYGYIVIPLEFMFAYWFFFHEMRVNGKSRLALISAALYVVAFLADQLWLSEKRFSFSSFSYTLGNLLLLIILLVHFLYLVNRSGIIGLGRSFIFWVCLGMLVFYLGSFPFYGLWNTLLNYPVLFNNYWISQMYLDFMMYLCFIIAFKWGKEN